MQTVLDRPQKAKLDYKRQNKATKDKTRLQKVKQDQKGLISLNKATVDKTKTKKAS